MEYRCVAEGFNKRKLVPINEDIWDTIGDNRNTDWYSSIYLYKDKHYREFNETYSLAGIQDVTTERLCWDFDDPDNLEKAKSDAKILCERLLQYGLTQDSIKIAFSGMKGFSVELVTTHRFTPNEFKNINLTLANGLETNDTQIYDAQRIFRVTGTKHNKSGLYKYPLNINQLSDLPIRTIKELATDVSNLERPDDIVIDIPEIILNMKGKEDNKLPTTLDLNDPVDLDFTSKPRGFTNCKFALLNGFFDEGSRSNSMMALGATCKSLGFPKDITYGMLKGASRLQASRTKEEEFPKKEIWETVIKQIYSPTWKGAIYSCRNQPWLQKICESLGPNKCKHVGDAEMGFVGSNEMCRQFEDFSVNIEKNTIKTGIDRLDEAVQLTIGMPVALLGAPSSGKCLGFNTPILMYDGTIKKVQDVQVGDQIMGDDSTPRNVLSLSRGREKLFNILQNYGDSYVVNESHILSLQCGASFTSSKLKKKYQRKLLIDLAINEYKNSSKKFKKYYKGYKVGVEYPDKPLILDPYILGYWLGDGTTGEPEFSCHKLDDIVLQEFREFANIRKLKLVLHHESENGQTWAINTDIKYIGKNSFTDDLRGYEVFNHKHIPTVYLINSRKKRLRLLAGLIDSDGHYSKTTNTYEVTFKLEELANNLVTLVRSLGFKAVKNSKVATWNSFTKGKQYNGSGIYYRVYIGGDGLEEIPCLLARKQAKPIVRRTNALLSKIELIPLPIGDYYGFEIDGNHRFLLGDFTVTHNTSLAIDILNNTSLSNISSAFFSMDMYGPLVYMKQIQKHFGYNTNKVHEIFKHDKKHSLEINEFIKDQYKHVKFSLRAGHSVQQMREIINDYEQKSGDKVKLAMIDYLECIAGPYTDSTANTGKIAGELRDFATEMNMCVMTLVQPPKSAGDAASPLTSMRQIKGSSMLEQSFRVILGIYREGFGPGMQVYDKYLTINALKNTMGPLFQLDNYWDGSKGEIRELDNTEIADLASLRKILESKKAMKHDSWVTEITG